MSTGLSPLENLLRHERHIVVAALWTVAVLAWVYTMSGAGMGMSAFEMSDFPWAGSSEHNMTMTGSGLAYMLVLLVMWWVMMVAMMLPSATPTILLAAALNRRSTSDHPPYGTAMFFTSGYLLAWFVFSLGAVIAQLTFDSFGYLSSMMHSESTYLATGLLIAAGIWQFSPIKQACLRYCRSPVEFLTRHRLPGNQGALVMGIRHGTYCLGCCWFLMALLFVGGVMNLYWIVGLALFVLIEKSFSNGILFGRIAGAGFIVSGLALLIL